MFEVVFTTSGRLATSMVILCWAFQLFQPNQGCHAFGYYTLASSHRASKPASQGRVFQMFSMFSGPFVFLVLGSIADLIRMLRQPISNRLGCPSRAYPDTLTPRQRIRTHFGHHWARSPQHDKCSLSLFLSRVKPCGSEAYGVLRTSLWRPQEIVQEAGLRTCQ